MKTRHDHRCSSAARAARPRLTATLGCAIVAGASGACAAEVTFERLANPEPQNLADEPPRSARTVTRRSTPSTRRTSRNLKLAFALPLGGTSGNEYLEVTPVVEDGFMYVTDVWSVVYKIDVRSGTTGRILWKMDPGTQKPDRNRGVALWGNYVDEALRLDPKLARAYLGRGLAWLWKGDNDKAIADLTEAIHLEPGVMRPTESGASPGKRRGEYDRAIADFTEAIRFDPNCAIAADSVAKPGNSRGTSTSPSPTTTSCPARSP